MVKDKEWLEMWERKAFIKDEYLCVGRDPKQDAVVICEDIKQKLLLNKDDLVLDIGCGGGVFADILSPEVKGIIGTDTSFNMVKRANLDKNKKNNVRFIQGETNTFPFKDKSFNKIICYSSAFNYSIKDYYEAKEYLKEIKRIAKPGALVLIGELHDISQRWRVAPGRINRVRRILHSLKKKGIKRAFLKIFGRLPETEISVRNINNQKESDPAKMQEDIHYQKKWLNESLWYSRRKMLKIFKKFNLDGEIKERREYLPYHEREFDILFKVKAD